MTELSYIKLGKKKSDMQCTNFLQYLFRKKKSVTCIEGLGFLGLGLGLGGKN